MGLKTLLLFSIFGCSAELCAYVSEAVLVKPKEEDKGIVNFLFFDEIHGKRPLSVFEKIACYLFGPSKEVSQKVSQVETVISVLQEAEKQGNPFHVLIEKVNPICRKYVKEENRCLLSDLAWRAELELTKETVIESVETRIKIGVANNMWHCDTALPILCYVNDPDKQEMVDHLGKNLFDLTFQDLYDELDAMMKTARQARELCQNEPKLYECLNVEIINCECFYQDFRHRVECFGFPPEQELASLLGDKYKQEKIRIAGALHIVSSSLFNFHELKRIIELEREVKERKILKDILIIAGGCHNEKIRQWLETTDKYAIVERVKPGDFKMGNKVYSSDTPVPDDHLVWLMRMCLSHHLLKQALAEQEKDIFVLAGLLYFVCAALTETVKSSLIN